MILLLSGLALALDHRVVRPGDTVASVAAAESVDATVLRALNGLGPDAEPPSGAVLLLPGLDDGAPAAVVLALSGGVTAAPPGSPAIPAAPGAHLAAGTLVCTAPAAFATLRLATAAATRVHDEITLLGGTCVTLDAAWSAPSAHASVVSVRAGSVSVRGDDDPSGSVTVRTDAGVSTSDRGAFRVTVESGATRTEALDGEVAVVGQGGEVALPGGFGTRTRPGAAPLPPVALLPAARPLRPEDGAVLRRPDFAWNPVDRALGYRVEIATDPAFTDLVHAEEVGPPPWRPDLLLLPQRRALWWRVASFDRTGFLGQPSPARALELPPGVGP